MPSTRKLRRYVRSQRSQSMTEFALIAPLLLLLLFGILDFGRAVYYLVTIDQADNEAARVAIRAPTPPNPDFYAPNNAQVVNALQSEAPALVITQPSCINGLASGAFDTSLPSDNTGYVYITAPGGVAPTGSAPYFNPANAPGGQPATSGPVGACAQVVPAGITPGQVNVPLQVTIRFNYVPVTPLIANFVTAGHPIVLTGYAVYRTEY